MAAPLPNIPISALTPAGKYRLWKRLKYKPHQGQRKFHDRTERYRVVAAASRMGKSTGAAEEGVAYSHIPRKMIWCVGPTYDLSEKTFRIIWREMIDKRKYPVKRKSYRDRIIVFEWDTEVHGKSAQNPDSLLGEGVDFMIVDEAARISKEVWEEYLLMRLLDKAGAALIISSTKGTEGWFPELFRRGRDPRHPDWWSVRCPLTDNTTIPNLQKEIKRLEREMSEEAFAQEVLGKFVPYGGLVYKEFKDLVHVSKEAEFNPELPITAALDFGTRNPTAFYLGHRTSEDLFDVFYEYHVPGLDTMQHAEALAPDVMEFINRCKHKTIRCFHDPSGLNESMIFKKIIPCLSMYAAVNDLEPGINTVRYHLKHDDKYDRPHIRINPRCENLIYEFGSYHYKRASDRGLTGLSEKPVPVDDHGLDALRYWLHTECPANASPICLDILDNEFADEYIGIQEAGHGYYEEIDTLKSLAYPENQAQTDPEGSEEGA